MEIRKKKQLICNAGNGNKSNKKLPAKFHQLNGSRRGEKVEELEKANTEALREMEIEVHM